MTKRTRLEDAISSRREFGLPAGRAHVRRVLRRGRAYTARESRWLRRRERVESSTWDTPLTRYLERHDDVLGGWTVVARFPARPYLLVRLTRDRARHAAQLRRLTPRGVTVRTATAEHTYEELEALAGRIQEDAAAGDGFIGGYGDAGFSSVNASVDVATGSVVVRLVSARDDHLAYFRARYGPLLRTVVTGRRFECAQAGALISG